MDEDAREAGAPPATPPEPAKAVAFPTEPAAAVVPTEPAMEEPWRPRAAGDVPRTLAKLLALPRAAGDEDTLLLDRRAESDLAVEEFTFHSEPGETVTGMLAKSEGRAGRLPGVLCLHDVNQGRKTVMGERYYYDSRLGWLRGWGREIARHGVVAATITQRTFGKRGGEPEEQGRIELIYGRTLMGAFVWEALQALDMLARRDDVDPGRLGIVGYGLGGIVGFYTALLDDRVKALVTACGGVGSLDVYARWSDPSFHDLSYFIPGILDHFDHPNLVAALAPRAYLLLTRDADVGMPMEGIRRAEWEGGAPYREMAIEDRFRVSVRPGDHDFTADDLAEAVEWLTRWLSEDAARAFAAPDRDALALED